LTPSKQAVHKLPPIKHVIIHNSFETSPYLLLILLLSDNLLQPLNVALESIEISVHLLPNHNTPIRRPGRVGSHAAWLVALEIHMDFTCYPLNQG
jgi:hypothetical protein